MGAKNNKALKKQRLVSHGGQLTFNRGFAARYQAIPSG